MKKKNYDLYKCYGLLKTMQEKNKEIEKMLQEVIKELNCSVEWVCNIDSYYNITELTIEDVKKMCDYYFNRE